MTPAQDDRNRILICGSRHWDDAWIVQVLVYGAISSCADDPVIIHGAALGADTMAADAARHTGTGIESYPPDWAKYGKSAGPHRNQQMLDSEPDVVIAFTDDLESSVGTRDMVTRAHRAGIPVYMVSRYGRS